VNHHAVVGKAPDITSFTSTPLDSGLAFIFSETYSRADVDIAVTLRYW
jgi:hypothetical protein